MTTYKLYIKFSRNTKEGKRLMKLLKPKIVDVNTFTIEGVSKINLMDMRRGIWK